MSIEDILICDQCGNDLSIYDNVSIDFGLNGEGFYAAECWCPTCNAHARININFNYEITSTNIKYWEAKK